MTAVAERLVITVPSVVQGMPEATYHADPVPAGSLSHSGAKKLLPPYCPAIYRWEADNGGEHKPEFDFGHAAHREQLGVGMDLVIVNEKDWKKKAAQEARDTAYAEGKTPLLARDHETVKAMGRALRADPVASALLNPEHGVAEQSLFWVDADFDVWRRCRIDWWSTRPSARPLAVDYKSAASLDDTAISRAVHSWGYHQQDPFYTDGIRALLDPDAAFVFLFQMKTPPFLCRVVTLSPDAVRLGRERNTRALERFRDCQKTGVWPGYSTDVTEIGLPRYAEAQWAAEQYEEN